MVLILYPYLAVPSFVYPRHLGCLLLHLDRYLQEPCRVQEHKADRIVHHLLDLPCRVLPGLRYQSARSSRQDAR